jgi:hypothetical protein
MNGPSIKKSSAPSIHTFTFGLIIIYQQRAGFFPQFLRERVAKGSVPKGSVL